MSLQTTLTACLERAVENHEAAGINLLVLRDGEELCYAQAGMADIAGGKPVRRDSNLPRKSPHSAQKRPCILRKVVIQ